MTGERFRICGLDEAGRGALAGPMVVAAVILNSDFNFKDAAPRIVVKDSKQLSNPQREKAYRVIEENSLAIEIEIMTVEEIETLGVGRANIEGFKRLIERVEANQYIVDGRWRFPDLGSKTQLVTCMIDADETIPATMSAGIVAKYKRDLIMLELHNKHQVYGWDTNTGHGTQKHMEAITTYGTTEHHRQRFVETALRNYRNRLQRPKG